MNNDRLELGNSISVILPNSINNFFDVCFNGYEEISLFKIRKILLDNNVVDIVTFPYKSEKNARTSAINLYLIDFINSLKQATDILYMKSSSTPIRSIQQDFSLRWLLSLNYYDSLHFQLSYLEETKIIRDTISSLSIPEAKTTLLFLENMQLSISKTRNTIKAEGEDDYNF